MFDFMRSTIWSIICCSNVNVVGGAVGVGVAMSNCAAKFVPKVGAGFVGGENCCPKFIGPGAGFVGRENCCPKSIGPKFASYVDVGSAVVGTPRMEFRDGGMDWYDEWSPPA